jgi:hypothetical protein
MLWPSKFIRPEEAEATFENMSKAQFRVMLRI